MSMISIGDLSQNLLLRNRATELKQTVATLTEELSSGRVSDPSQRLGGDYSHLIDIDRNLTRLAGYSIAANEARLFAGATQSGLERIQGITGSLFSGILSATSSNLAGAQDNFAQQAQSGLDDVISTLNGSVAGRSLFAGTATDKPPLESSTMLLDELRSVLIGLDTAAEVTQAAEDWFADPAGFRAVIYKGSADGLAPIQVAAGQHVGLSLKADDPDFRDLLRIVAVASLATDPTINLDAENRAELLRSSGDQLLASEDRLTLLRGDLGYSESRIEEAATRNESARTSFEYAKGALLAADPFETATRLDDVQFQLEALYSVTVRTSRLSLLSFLK